MNDKIFQEDYKYPTLIVIASYEFRNWLPVFPFEEGQYLSNITQIPEMDLFAYEFEGGGTDTTLAQEQFLNGNSTVHHYFVELFPPD